jgi:predicted Rossmann fold flavoprotein
MKDGIFDLAVAGGGPAGLAAAVAAAGRGARVVLLEKMRSPGLRLLASGGGRCNLSNTLPPDRFAERLGRFGRFVIPALNVFGSDKLLEFLAAGGVRCSADDGFHYFPVSGRASDVLGVFLRGAEKNGVRIVPGARVAEIRAGEGAVSALVTESGDVFECRAAVLACGGAARPELGASGDSFSLAERLGHSVVKPLPALSPLICAEDFIGGCAGISLPFVRLFAGAARNKISSSGEILFTHGGFSGPAALDISGDAARLLEKSSELPLRVNFRPDISPRQWSDDIEAWRRDFGRKHLSKLLSSRLPRALSEALCCFAGAAPSDAPVCELKAPHAEAVIRALTDCPLTLTGVEGFEKAMLSSGGVTLKEIDPDTMRSRLVRGLFFAGEAADIQGPCGGFNIQWAFSSGFLAGLSAAKLTPGR